MLRSVAKPGAVAKPSRGKAAPLPPAAVSTTGLVSGRRDTPLGGPGILENIIGTDERTRITDTKDPPWRTICALAIEAPFGSFVGTGWFAGPRTIVTAGHVVWDDAEMGGWATSITVTPGQSGTTAPFGSVTTTSFEALHPWLEARDADHDVGVIHLDHDVGDSWFGVASPDDADLQAAMVNISGYPADKGGPNSGGRETGCGR